jgi:UDP-glucose 4-epimerase
MTLVWVLGSSGLLGSAMTRRLRDSGCEVFTPAARLPWGDGDAMERELRDAVQAFSERLAHGTRWQIYWAAGAGTMGSRAEDLAGETHALSTLLRFLRADQRLMQADGAIALASSAGAIYAGVSDGVITEETAAAPTTPYAAEKLRQEELLRAFTLDPTRPKALLARISTLYGAGQAAGKKQGLLSHIARSILRNRPIQIYVPFDTVRDYIEAGDAADRIIQALRALPAAARCQIRIIASERPATIAEIIAIFKRIARKNPRIITSASRLSTLYARRLLFKSIVPLAEPVRPPQQIAVGIAQLLMAERTVYTARPPEVSRAVHQSIQAAAVRELPQRVAP